MTVPGLGTAPLVLAPANFPAVEAQPLGGQGPGRMCPCVLGLPGPGAVHSPASLVSTQGRRRFWFVNWGQSVPLAGGCVGGEGHAPPCGRSEVPGGCCALRAVGAADVVAELCQAQQHHDVPREGRSQQQCVPREGAVGVTGPGPDCVPCRSWRWGQGLVPTFRTEKPRPSAATGLTAGAADRSLLWPRACPVGRGHRSPPHTGPDLEETPGPAKETPALRPLVTAGTVLLSPGGLPCPLGLANGHHSFSTAAASLAGAGAGQCSPGICCFSYSRGHTTSAGTRHVLCFTLL